MTLEETEELILDFIHFFDPDPFNDQAVNPVGTTQIDAFVEKWQVCIPLTDPQNFGLLETLTTFTFLIAIT